MSNDKLAASYTLLAEIRSGSDKLSDMIDLFTPIVRDTVSSMWSKRIRRGRHVTEISQEVKELYGLSIPETILSETIYRINSSRTNPYIAIGDDKHFVVNRDPGTEYEQSYRSARRSVDELTLAFDKYLEDVDGEYDITHDDLLSFFENNSISLSYLLNGDYQRIELERANDVLICSFLESIMDSAFHWEIVRRMYVGSLIAAYLTLEPSKKNVTLHILLDTNVLLALHGLSSESSISVALQLLELTRNYGVKVEVLNSTISEAKGVLQEAMSVIGNRSTGTILDHPDSVIAACAREGIEKITLGAIYSGLKKRTEELGVLWIDDTNWRRIYDQTPEYQRKSEKYIDAGRSANGAKHDVITELYVEDLRQKGNNQGASVLSMQYWLVSFRRRKKRGGGRLNNVTIDVESLIVAMWLTHPGVATLNDVMQLSDTVLLKLSSSTLATMLYSDTGHRRLAARLIKLVDDGQINHDEYAEAVSVLSNSVISADVREILANHDQIQDDKVVEMLRSTLAIERERKSRYQGWLSGRTDEVNREYFVGRNSQLNTQFQGVPSIARICSFVIVLAAVTGIIMLGMYLVSYVLASLGLTIVSTRIDSGHLQLGFSTITGMIYGVASLYRSGRIYLPYRLLAVMIDRAFSRIWH